MPESEVTYDEYALEFQTGDDREYFEGDKLIYTLHGPPYRHFARFTDSAEAARAYFLAVLYDAADVRITKQTVTTISSEQIELSAEDVMAMRRATGQRGRNARR